MADFWWDANVHSRKIHWQCWERLCLPKDKSGMGFRDIKNFNQALLAKHAWRLLQNPDCLFSKIMKSRYFYDACFLDAVLGDRPSFAWRSIMFGRDLLCKGLVKKVGDGESIYVWTESWLEDNGLRAPLRKNILVNVDLRVSGLIDFSTGTWDPDILNDLFFPNDIQQIKAIKPVTSEKDFYAWRHNKSGDFSVKSAYWLASQLSDNPNLLDASAQPSTNALKSQVWKLQTDPKIKVFLWKVLSGALPVAEALGRKGLSVDRRCQGCGEEGESINHTIFSCPISKLIWALSDYPSPEFGFHNGSVFSNIQHLLANKDNSNWPLDLTKSFPWIIWRIGKNINLYLFEGKSFNPLESVEKIRADVDEWFEAQFVEPENEPRINTHIRNSASAVLVPEIAIWERLPTDWVKCNVGVSWSKRNKLAGSSWVLRNDQGVVLLHSRRAFSNCLDKESASFLCFVWAVESMISHKVNRVIFELQDSVLVKAVGRPIAWPSFRYQSSVLRKLLLVFEGWQVNGVLLESNRGANLIAQSVTGEGRLQSYVAVCHPFWLNRVFVDERVLSSG